MLGKYGEAIEAFNQTLELDKLQANDANLAIRSAWGTFLGILLGFSIFSIYPLALSRANDVVDENKDIVEISRSLLFAYGLGSFIAPIFLGLGLYYYSEFIFGFL